MAATTVPRLTKDLSPFLKAYEDGTIERLQGTNTVPPSLDPNSPVLSKDVVYYPEHNLSCRLYLPNGVKPHQKLPLLVYVHGGAFFIESAFSPTYHNYLNQLVAEANVIAVSVDYRLAPEHHLPTAFDDCWTALNWVTSHVNRNGPERWLNSHANFDNVFLAGDSAGATITQQMGMRLSKGKLPDLKVRGIILVHPYFWGLEPVLTEVKEKEKRSVMEERWMFANPKSTGVDDPLFNPILDPNFGGLNCHRVLVFVAGKDILRERGWNYYQNLHNCGWHGKVEIMECKDVDHVFHLSDPGHESAAEMLKKIASFINQGYDKAIDATFGKILPSRL